MVRPSTEIPQLGKFWVDGGHGAEDTTIELFVNRALHEPGRLVVLQIYNAPRFHPFQIRFRFGYFWVHREVKSLALT